MFLKIDYDITKEISDDLKQANKGITCDFFLLYKYVTKR